MMTLTCEWCDTPLSGGVDTFGRVGESFCAICWLTIAEDESDSIRDQARLRDEYRAVKNELRQIEEQIGIESDPFAKSSLIERRDMARETEDGLWWASRFVCPRYARGGRG